MFAGNRPIIGSVIEHLFDHWNFFCVCDRLLIKCINEKMCYFDSDEATSLCLSSLLCGVTQCPASNTI